MVDAAERVGSVFKSKWSLFQQPSTKHAVQERFLSAAASTSFLVRKGISETKEKVSVGKIKVEEVSLCVLFLVTSINLYCNILSKICFSLLIVY